MSHGSTQSVTSHRLLFLSITMFDTNMMFRMWEEGWIQLGRSAGSITFLEFMVQLLSCWIVMKSFSLLLKLLQETGNFSLIFLLMYWFHHMLHWAFSYIVLGEGEENLAPRLFHLVIFSLCSWPDFFAGFIFSHIWLNVFI